MGTKSGKAFTSSALRIFFSLAVLAALSQSTALPTVASTKIDIIGPLGSGKFGTSVTALPNGNLVITDPYYDAVATADVGAVYLYNGATGDLISALTGSANGDLVGYGGVKVLANGNYVVNSYYWSNGSAFSAGAVTWGSAITGVNGVVSVANSLVGSTSDDLIGWRSVITLTNGNYVVSSPYWSHEDGAVTWGNGFSGTTGPVSPSNSLVGSNGGRVGEGGATALTNGNYVVSSYNWHNGTVAKAGAVTWGNGFTGQPTGLVTTSNSLVGSAADDLVGVYGVTVLTNGNYVVKSAMWDNGAIDFAGAATWGNGFTGQPTGPVTTTNSLVGSTAYDLVGARATALTNGNYVVDSYSWTSGSATGAGAVTWGNGFTGQPTGPVTTSNSLVGSTTDDSIGYNGVIALSNGNYVVLSQTWYDGTAYDVGAATWGNGITGQPTGPVTSANSLVGSITSDGVGEIAVALSNGNYVVCSPEWTNGSVAYAGAATWGNGSTGITGPVTTGNSLVGSTANDSVCEGGVTALTNGNYVVRTFAWDNGATTNVGAATWGNGFTGQPTGPVTTANSLVGKGGDRVGEGFISPLKNGSYIVGSPYWDNGGTNAAGAVTWGNGFNGFTGLVTTANSLVGSTTDDQVGGGGMSALGDGDYAILSENWDNGGTADAGAVTWGSGFGGMVGPINQQNSVIGLAASGGSDMVYTYDSFNKQLVVGRPADNIVTLFRPYSLNLPSIMRQ